MRAVKTGKIERSVKRTIKVEKSKKNCNNFFLRTSAKVVKTVRFEFKSIFYLKHDP